MSAATEGLQRPGRPALLGHYLDFTREQSQLFSDKYNAFVLSANAAQAKADACLTISTQMSGKISFICAVDNAQDVLNDDDDQEDEGDVRAGQQQHHSWSNKRAADSSGILEFLLEYYAKIGNSSKSVGTTFASAASEPTWGFAEIELFSRDFGLLPKLVSREELRSLFLLMRPGNHTSSSTSTSSGGGGHSLKIDTLREFLARLAVFVYGKPGLVALLAQAGVDIVGEGNSPSARVRNLVHYLRLGEPEAVRRMAQDVSAAGEGTNATATATAASPATGVAAAAGAYELEASQELYTPDLASLLLCHCRDGYNDDTGAHSRAVQSQGSFLDLGRLEAGAAVRVRLHITNTSDDDLRFDITARDFGDQKTQVRTLPSQLIPGLVRTASVSFTAGLRPSCHVGLVDVKWANVRHADSADCISLPVFFFVGLQALDDRRREHSALTLATLPSGLRSRLGGGVGVETLTKKFGLRRAPRSGPGIGNGSGSVGFGSGSFSSSFGGSFALGEDSAFSASFYSTR